MEDVLLIQWNFDVLRYAPFSFVEPFLSQKKIQLIQPQKICTPNKFQFYFFLIEHRGSKTWQNLILI